MINNLSSAMPEEKKKVVYSQKLAPMSHSFHQLHYHLVFAVAYRDAAINAAWKDRLYQYIGGIIKKLSGHPIMIGGISDHIHILLSLPPTCSLPDCVRKIKTASTAWINDNRLVRGHFAWQEGCGYFTVSHRDVPELTNYIATQEQHHCRFNFHDEYRVMLDRSEKGYEVNQLFKPLK